MNNIPDDAVRETWENMSAKCFELAERIEADSIKQGDKFDAIVVIPRGSYFPVNIIARKLGFTATDLLHACIESYKSGAIGVKGEFKTGQMPSQEEVKDKSLLIIDEVCDTGDTLSFLSARLKELGAINIKSAVLHYKPEQSKSDYVPDWYVAKTNDWIVYPWELAEISSDQSLIKNA